MTIVLAFLRFSKVHPPPPPLPHPSLKPCSSLTVYIAFAEAPKRTTKSNDGRMRKQSRIEKRPRAKNQKNVQYYSEKKERGEAMGRRGRS
jgi:hypothetical protein